MYIRDNMKIPLCKYKEGQEYVSEPSQHIDSVFNYPTSKIVSPACDTQTGTDSILFCLICFVFSIH